jgi:hypothetical protein
MKLRAILLRFPYVIISILHGFVFIAGAIVPRFSRFPVTRWNRVVSKVECNVRDDRFWLTR